MIHEIVCIGASLGGVHALTAILPTLPKNFGLPVVVVLHRRFDSETYLADLIQKHTKLKVCEPEDKETIRSGHLYLAPPDYHLLIDRERFHLSTEAPVCYSRPSIDVLLQSAAEAFGKRAVGLILTGASDDGAFGAALLAESGALVVIQDPRNAEAKRMPQAALSIVRDCQVLSLHQISHLLSTLEQVKIQPAFPRFPSKVRITRSQK